MTLQHVHVRIEGRVQGVGFRWFVQNAARGLDVAGEVRNRPDGSVEVQAEGSRKNLDRFLDLLRSGPSGARVTDLAATWSEAPSRHRGFRIGF